MHNISKFGCVFSGEAMHHKKLVMSSRSKRKILKIKPVSFMKISSFGRDERTTGESTTYGNSPLGMLKFMEVARYLPS
jgi:hypothetical protein